MFLHACLDMLDQWSDMFNYPYFSSIIEGPSDKGKGHVI